MKNCIFVPQEDITVKELADIVSGLTIVVPKPVVDKLDEGIKRHFKEVPEKPRIIIPR